MKLLLVLAFLFLTLQLTAEVGVFLEDEKTDIRSARKTYLGGVDEEDIEVDKELTAPYRVINLKVVQKKVKDNLLKAAQDSDDEDDQDHKEKQDQKKTN
ncbi:MAG: hypothetical protein HOO06_07110 [Bdellovibrionaceae bacterium]|jgi:hypothetical protein|nr:hypothetical protein [Pseudobdellovibrionaceae bacterium]